MNDTQLGPAEELQAEAALHKEGRYFRPLLGLIVVIGGLLALGLLYFIPVPATNRDALMLAIGIVLGWGGSIVNYEYGGSVMGKKAAEKGMKS